MLDYAEIAAVIGNHLPQRDYPRCKCGFEPWGSYTDTQEQHILKELEKAGYIMITEGFIANRLKITLANANPRLDVLYTESRNGFGYPELASAFLGLDEDDPK